MFIITTYTFARHVTYLVKVYVDKTSQNYVKVVVQMIHGHSLSSYPLLVLLFYTMTARIVY